MNAGRQDVSLVIIKKVLIKFMESKSLLLLIGTRTLNYLKPPSSTFGGVFE